MKLYLMAINVLLTMNLSAQTWEVEEWGTRYRDILQFDNNLLLQGYNFEGSDLVYSVEYFNEQGELLVKKPIGKGNALDTKFLKIDSSKFAFWYTDDTSTNVRILDDSMRLITKGSTNDSLKFWLFDVKERKGDYYLAGAYNNTNGFYGALRCIKKDGTEKWSYLLDSNKINSSGKSVSIYGNEIIVTGYTNNRRTQLIHCLDTNGVQKWKFEKINNLWWTPQGIAKVIQIAENKLLACGGSSATDGLVHLLELDSLGNEIRSANLKYINGASIRGEVNHIELLQSGDYFLGISSWSLIRGDIIFHTRVVLIDKDWNVICERTHPKQINNWSKTWDYLLTEKGTYYGVGDASGKGFRFKENINCLTTELQNIEAVNIKYYPVPAHDVMFIEVLGQVNDIKFEAISIDGRKVDSGVIQSGKISILEWPAGQYIITVRTKQDVSSFKIIKY